MSTDKKEKELLDELIDVIDKHLTEINSKLDDIIVLLFIIALPTIIAIIIFLLFLLGLIALPSLT